MRLASWSNRIMLPCWAYVRIAGARPFPKVVTSHGPESIQVCRLRPLSARGEVIEPAVGEAAGDGVGAE